MDPAQDALLAAKLLLRAWTPGELVSWEDLKLSARLDKYVVGRGHGRYQAIEMYCPIPDCPCERVAIRFRGRPRVQGAVVMAAAPEGVELRVDSEDDRARLERLWAAYRERHPDYIARFRGRYSLIKQVRGPFCLAARERHDGTVFNLLSSLQQLMVTALRWRMAHMCGGLSGA